MFGGFLPVADQPKTLQYDPGTRAPNPATTDATRKLYHGQSFLFQQSDSDFKRECCHLPRALAADGGDYGGQSLHVSRHLHRLKQAVFKKTEYTVMCKHYPNGFPRPESICSKCYDRKMLRGPQTVASPNPLKGLYVCECEVCQCCLKHNCYQFVYKYSLCPDQFDGLAANRKTKSCRCSCIRLPPGRVCAIHEKNEWQRQNTALPYPATLPGV